jgi:hypothetical protein
MLLGLSGALAQSRPTIVGFGPPAQPAFAPGDILILQVVGLKTVLTGPIKASGPPLPTVLGGISVSFRRLGINLPGPPVAAPLFSIEQTLICTDELLRPPPPPDCLLTSITVQVPLFGATAVGDHGGFFSISENGVTGNLSWGRGSLVNIRVLDACSGGACGARVSAVTHADGTLVTAASPAKPGEVVVIYATGLGSTNPPVSAGQATPAPAPRAGSLYLQFDFSTNARPRFPEHTPFSPGPPGPTPEFVGLTPGQVGLYQINVKIPETIPPIPPCRISETEGVNVISNLTITVATSSASQNRSDGAGICVAPPQ